MHYSDIHELHIHACMSHKLLKGIDAACRTGSGRSWSAPVCFDPVRFIRRAGVMRWLGSEEAPRALVSPPLDKVKTSFRMLDLDASTRQTSPSAFIQELSTVIGGSAGPRLFWGPGQRMLHSNDPRPWVPEVFITG